jgi:hypothetical protein
VNRFLDWLGGTPKYYGIEMLLVATAICAAAAAMANAVAVVGMTELDRFAGEIVGGMLIGVV